MTSEQIRGLEARLGYLHDQAVEARDGAQNVIAEVREIRQWLTQVQIETAARELETLKTGE